MNRLLAKDDAKKSLMEKAAIYVFFNSIDVKP
jgi:hypothetical protein